MSGVGRHHHAVERHPLLPLVAPRPHHVCKHLRIVGGSKRIRFTLIPDVSLHRVAEYRRHHAVPQHARHFVLPMFRCHFFERILLKDRGVERVVLHNVALCPRFSRRAAPCTRNHTYGSVQTVVKVAPHDKCNGGKIIYVFSVAHNPTAVAVGAWFVD